MWSKGNANVLLMGMQSGTATLENNMEYTLKIKNGTPFSPSDSTSGNTSQGS